MISAYDLNTAYFFIKLKSLPLELQAKIFSYLPLGFFEKLKTDDPDEVKKIKQVWKRVFSAMLSSEQTLIFKKDCSCYSYSNLNFYLKNEIREIFGYPNDVRSSVAIRDLALSSLQIESFVDKSLEKLPSSKIVKLILIGITHHHFAALKSSIKKKISFLGVDIKKILEVAVASNEPFAVEAIGNWDQIGQIGVVNFFEILKLCFENDKENLLQILMEAPLFKQLNQDQISYLFLEGCKERKARFIASLRSSSKAADVTGQILGQGLRFGSLTKDSIILGEILRYPTSDQIENMNLSKGLYNSVVHEYIENIELILSSNHAERISPVTFGEIFALSCEKKRLSITSCLMMSQNYKLIEKKHLIKALRTCCEKNSYIHVAAIISHPNFGEFDKSIAYQLYNEACANNFPELKLLLFSYIPQTFQLCEKIKELNCAIS